MPKANGMAMKTSPMRVTHAAVAFTFSTPTLKHLVALHGIGFAKSTERSPRSPDYGALHGSRGVYPPIEPYRSGLIVALQTNTTWHLVGDMERLWDALGARDGAAQHPHPARQ